MIKKGEQQRRKRLYITFRQIHYQKICASRDWNSHYHRNFLHFELFPFSVLHVSSISKQIWLKLPFQNLLRATTSCKYKSLGFVAPYTWSETKKTQFIRPSTSIKMVRGTEISFLITYKTIVIFNTIFFLLWKIYYGMSQRWTNTDSEIDRVIRTSDTRVRSWESRRWNWKFRKKHFWIPNPEVLLHLSYSFWSYLSTSGSCWDFASSLPWKTCKKYRRCQPLPLVDSFRSKTNLNVTEILDSDFKNDIPGIFNFTIGIRPFISGVSAFRTTILA